jgi:hypothetical protein
LHSAHAVSIPGLAQGPTRDVPSDPTSAPSKPIRGDPHRYLKFGVFAHFPVHRDRVTIELMRHLRGPDKRIVFERPSACVRRRSGFSPRDGGGACDVRSSKSGTRQQVRPFRHGGLLMFVQAITSTFIWPCIQPNLIRVFGRYRPKSATLMGAGQRCEWLFDDGRIDPAESEPQFECGEGDKIRSSSLGARSLPKLLFVIICISQPPWPFPRILAS